MKFSKDSSRRSEDPARASLAPFPATRRARGPRPFDPTPPCAYTDRPLQEGPRILPGPVKGITGTQPPRRGIAPPRAQALVLCGALLSAGAGGREARASVIGPTQGLSHPMVGQKAPDFAAQDPAGPWLPLTSLKDKPVALLFFRPGAAFAPDLARELGHYRDDPSYRPIVFLGIARESMDRIREFIKLYGLTLPILRDPGPIAPSYDIGDVPTVVLIDVDGLVRFQLGGYLGRQYQPRLQATVDALRKLPAFGADKSGSLDLTYTTHPKAPVFSAR